MIYQNQPSGLQVRYVGGQVTTLESRFLNSLAKSLQYLNSFDVDFSAGTQLRSQAEDRVFQGYYSVTEQSLTGLMVIWEKVLEAKTYQHLRLDEIAFLAHYDHIQQKITAHSGTRDEKAETSKTIFKYWPELEEYIKTQSITFLKAIRLYCYTRFTDRVLRTLLTVTLAVNNECINRLFMNKLGARKTYGLTLRDWENAVNSNNMTSVPLGTLIGLGLALDKFGLIYRYEKSNKSFKAFSRIENLQSTPIQPHQEFPGIAKFLLFSKPSFPL